MDCKALAQAYLNTLNEQVELIMKLQHKLLVNYKGFNYVPFIDENNIFHIVKDMLADKLFTTERKINYAKIPNTSKGEVEEIEVNYFLNNDNIKEILKTKKVLRKVSLWLEFQTVH